MDDRLPSQNELEQSVFRTHLRNEEQALASIAERRTFLLTVFTVTTAFLAGLLVVDLKVRLNTLGYVGLGILSLNIFLIPIYFWVVFRNELQTFARRLTFWKRISFKEEIRKPTKEEREEFERLYPNDKKYKSRDILFDVIVFAFLVGLACFVTSLLLNTQSKVTSFQRKQECEKYYETLEKGGTVSVPEIFYSPKRDSCLFTRITIFEGGINYELVDALTKESLIFEWYDINNPAESDARDRFDTEVAAYR